MLENDNSVLRNDVLEAHLKGLVEALERMHNKFIGSGAENYYLTPALKRGFLFKANRSSKDNAHVFKEIEHYVNLKGENANDKDPIFEIKKDYLRDLKLAITILEKEAQPC